MGRVAPTILESHERRLIYYHHLLENRIVLLNTRPFGRSY